MAPDSFPGEKKDKLIMNFDSILFLKFDENVLWILIFSFPEIPLTGQIAVPTENQLPQRAQIVIAGAGLVGNSVACHVRLSDF